MINKIIMNNIASFKNKAVLPTDKKVNLIYGLNGTGKSTISNFLYDINKGEKLDKYTDCHIEPSIEDYSILVYNQKFITDKFIKVDLLDGVYLFTLDEGTGNALIEINNRKNEKEKLEELIKLEKSKKDESEKKFKDVSKLQIGKIWEIKLEIENNKLLDYCLTGYKSSKENLFNHIIGINFPNDKPKLNIDELENEISLISGDNTEKLLSLPTIDQTLFSIESRDIFKKQIVGNENSSVSELINSLNNSDWVKQGLTFLSDNIHQTTECPFCQEKTITEQLHISLKSYFDTAFENDLKLLNEIKDEYCNAINSIPDFSEIESHPIFNKQKTNISLLIQELKNILNDNVRIINDKIKTPSVSMTLQSSASKVIEFNYLILSLNQEIQQYNSNLDNANVIRENVKSTFWNLMRSKYDSEIKSYEKALNEYNHIQYKSDNLILQYKTQISKIDEEIITLQKSTVNIDDAIHNINIGLLDLGIDEFKIVKHEEYTYKISRSYEEEGVFSSLSEGEKMIISFLYFLEICKGKVKIEEVEKKKIIVIDDPISSLSHIFIFNIAQLIKKEFFTIDKDDKKDVHKKQFIQFFILTHSLYFFHELVKNMPKDTSLIKLQKDTNGSNISLLKKDDLQNDYQAFWSVIKNKNQHFALQANCMRQIVEYFFGFVQKKDLKKLFDNASLNGNKYEAFRRYMQRESHSDAINMSGYKEIDPEIFKEALKSLFEYNGYKEHYSIMMDENLEN